MKKIKCENCNKTNDHVEDMAVSRVSGNPICTPCARIEAMIEMYRANFNNFDHNIRFDENK